jgi:hypothetical protein
MGSKMTVASLIESLTEIRNVGVSRLSGRVIIGADNDFIKFELVDANINPVPEAESSASGEEHL